MMRRWSGSARLAAALAGLAAMAASCGSSSVTTASLSSVPGAGYAWTELAPGGKAIVRAIAHGSCPMATVDGKPVPMSVYAAATANFPLTTCETTVDQNVSAIQVGSQSVPPPPKALNRIAVVGDIGCFLSKTHTQACNDPAAFPAKQVSDMVAAEHPDLVVFVGDLYYSAEDCPADKQADCGGVPTGDRWSTWAYDFFTPYQSALHAAPWIFARGNHESCNSGTDNGGTGWFQLLALSFSACQDFTDPVRVDVLGQSFIVFDSALANDNPADQSQVDTYAAQFRTVHELAQGHTGAWFVGHRPLWSRKGSEPKDLLNLTLQAAINASGNTLFTDVNLILTGHTHTLGLFETADGRPAQVVSGGGGSQLDKDQGSWPGTAVDGTTFTTADLVDSFGFVEMTRSSATNSTWSLDYKRLNKPDWKDCTFQGRTLSC